MFRAQRGGNLRPLGRRDRQVAYRLETAADSADRIGDADLDLRTARALERRGLLTTSQLGNWYLTPAGTTAVAGDIRQALADDDLELIHAVALTLDELGITTAQAYADLSADYADMIRDRAALLSSRWTPCVRNTAEHAGHDGAIGTDCLAPGTITYETDPGGNHLWHLDGFGTNSEIPGWDHLGATEWAADLIAAGRVTGLPPAIVTGWRHRTGRRQSESLVPVFGPTANVDRDRDRPAAPTPASLATRIRLRPVPVPPGGGRTGTMLIRTGTTLATETGTAPAPGLQQVHYRVETRTDGGDWTEVQSGSTPPVYARPVRQDLVVVADTIRSNAAYVVGHGPGALDRPVRITTWTAGLADVGLVLITPTEGTPPS